MNRVQLVQVIVIIMALVMGYQMVIHFCFAIGNAINYFSGGTDQNRRYALSYGIISLLLAVSLFLIINNVSKLSLWIIDKVHPDENIKLNFSDKSTIYAVLLFLMLEILLKNVPIIIYQLYEILGRDYRTSDMRAFSPLYLESVYSLIIEAAIAFIILIKCKAIVQYFTKKIDPYDPHFINNETEPLPDN